MLMLGRSGMNILRKVQRTQRTGQSRTRRSHWRAQRSTTQLGQLDEQQTYSEVHPWNLRTLWPQSDGVCKLKHDGVLRTELLGARETGLSVAREWQG